jgi:hypothetical protein
MWGFNKCIPAAAGQEFTVENSEILLVHSRSQGSSDGSIGAMNNIAGTWLKPITAWG